MSVEHIEFLVEELSMEVFLRTLLPRIWSDLSFNVHPFQGKADLLARLPERLRGYRGIPSSQRIVVMVDRDNDDCMALKRQLEEAAQQAGLSAHSQGQHRRNSQVINRIVIEELEAWYLGDWEAIRRVYPGVPAQKPQRFRDPDAVEGGTWESFESILNRAGYHRTGLRKIEMAREIAPHMDPARNRSHSFHVFVQAIRALKEGHHNN